MFCYLKAITALREYPTPLTRKALTDTIENDKCFYRVRMQAAECLAQVIIVQAKDKAKVFISI